MELQQQVCSLDLAKRLKELGVKQEAFFWWSENTTPATLWRQDALGERDDNYDREYAAFTVAELGEMLPRRFVIEQKTFQLRTKPRGGNWLVGYTRPLSKKERRETRLPNYDRTHQVEDTTEADARAKMLVYLLENKLI